MATRKRRRKPRKPIPALNEDIHSLSTSTSSTFDIAAGLIASNASLIGVNASSINTLTSVVGVLSSSTSSAVDSLSGSTSSAVDSLSGSTSSAVNSLSGSTSSAVDSLSGSTSSAVNSLSGSTSTAVNSLSGSTSTVVDSLSTALNDTRLDILGLASEEIGVFGGIDGANSVVGYDLAGDPGDPGVPGSPNAGFTETGLFNYTSQTLYAKAPTSILFAADPAWLDGSLNDYATDTGWNILGASNNDTAIGGTYNDTISGEAGADSLLGGTGADSILGGVGSDTLLGEEGADSLLGGADGDSILGGDGEDSVYGEGGDDFLAGGDEADYIEGGADNDTVLGDGGSDSLLGGAGVDSILGGTGEDSVYGEGGDDFLAGGDDADYIEGGADNDTVLGDGGDDSLLGGVGVDSILGGSGADTMDGGAEGDSLLGEAGNDIISDTQGDNYIEGGADNDSITAGSGADTILGQEGNDTINGGGGADSIDGGAQDDLMLFATTAALTAAATVIGGADTDTLSMTTDSQTLVDSDFGKVNTTEVLEYANGANSGSFGSLAAAAGLDSVIGGTGSDTMAQLRAWDITEGGLYMSGGAGASGDIFNIADVSLLGDQGGAYTGDTISGGDATDAINVGGDDDITATTLGNISSVEELNFNAAVNVSLTGGEWDVATINGGAASDTLTVNTIDASAANGALAGGILINGVDDTQDSLIGGDAADTIKAATSNANLTNDTLTGGLGDDVFVLGDAADNFYGNTGTGSLAAPWVGITDFTIGDTLTGGDALRLYGNGLSSPTDFVTQATGSTGAGNLVINLYNDNLSGSLIYFADIGADASTAEIYEVTSSGSAKIAELQITDPSNVQDLFDNTQFSV